MDSVEQKAHDILQANIELTGTLVKRWDAYLGVRVPITLDDIAQALQKFSRSKDIFSCKLWAHTIYHFTHTYYYPTSSPFYSTEQLVFINRLIKVKLHTLKQANEMDNKNYQNYLNISAETMTELAQIFKTHNPSIFMTFDDDFIHIFLSFIEMKYIPSDHFTHLLTHEFLLNYFVLKQYCLYAATENMYYTQEETHQLTDIEGLLKMGMANHEKDAYYRLARFYKKYRQNNDLYQKYLTKAAILGDEYAILDWAQEEMNHGYEGKLWAFQVLIQKFNTLKDDLFNSYSENFILDNLITTLDEYCNIIAQFSYEPNNVPFYIAPQDALKLAGMSYFIAYNRYNETHHERDLAKKQTSIHLIKTLLGTHLKYVTAKAPLDLNDYSLVNTPSDSPNFDINIIVTYFLKSNLIIKLNTQRPYTITSAKDGYFDFTNHVTLEIVEPFIPVDNTETNRQFSFIHYNKNLNTIEFLDAEYKAVLMCQGKTIKLIKNDFWEDIKL